LIYVAETYLEPTLVLDHISNYMTHYFGNFQHSTSINHAPNASYR
jgi:hypothetical protein